MFTDNLIINILLIEDEEFDVKRVTKTIEPFSDKMHIAQIVSDGNSAITAIKEDKINYDIVIMDFQIAGNLMGEELIKRIKELDSSIQIIVITKMTVNITDYGFANKLLKAGAFWYCTKYPGDIDQYIYQPTDFIISVFNAYQKRILEREKRKSNAKFEKNIADILKSKSLIGNSDFAHSLNNYINKCAESNFSTLITGESGTGKELVAYNIHYRSSRKFENFVPINCGSLPHDLVESELFGYEKGAFTGAVKRKPGLFEIADNGTIFLDEITELPLNAQVKLLRVIQDGELEKLGRTEKVKVDVRIISATNKNIEEEVKAKRFRDDLYYRLNVVSIFVKPLRERKDDIIVLLKYYLEKYCLDMGTITPEVSDEALDFFKNYFWPGNIRELKNVVQRILFSGENIISVQMAKNATGLALFGDTKNIDGVSFPSPDKILPLKEIEKILREKYFRYVRENSSSDTEAALKLGLAPPNFYRMSKELGLK